MTQSSDPTPKASDTKRIGVSLPRRIHKKLKKMATDRDTTLQALCAEAIHRMVQGAAQ